jgi:hypothetical protein
MEVTAEVEKKKGLKKGVKVALKIFKYLAFTIVGLVVTLLLLTWIFEDKIKQFAIDRLNQNLSAPVKVESINLSFFSKFPYASLEFTHVLIEDPDSMSREKDTLLYAKTIFLEFSIWDILDNNYQVKNISASNAYVNLFVDRKGKENYDIWKESGDTTSSNFDFKLKKILFKDTRFHYVNQRSKQEFAFTFHDLKMTGHFTESEFDLSVKTNCQLHDINNRHISLLHEKKTFADFDLHVNQPASLYSVNTGHFRIGDLNFGVSGHVKDSTAGTLCNLHIAGQNISIESMLKTFPFILNDNISAYETSGMLQFEADITGLAGPKETPVIAARFNIGDGLLTEKASGNTLKKLRFDGTYHNKNKQGEEELVLENVSGIFSEGNFSGELKIVNLDKPHVLAKLNGNFRLDALQRFFKIGELETASGSLDLKASLDANFLYDETGEKWEMKIKKSAGTADLKNVSLHIKDHHVPYLDFNGIITLKNDHATVEELRGSLGKTDVELSGILNNLVPYLLLENQKLNIVADFYSKKVDLDDMFGGGTKEDTLTTRLQFPADINFNLDTRIDELVFDKFESKKITGNFKLIDQQFLAKDLEMRFAGGQCSGSVAIDGRTEDLFAISANASISEMRIQDLFISFRDFGQKEILAENIKGTISSEVRFAAAMDSRLVIDNNKIVANAGVNIRNGELIRIKTFIGIMEFLRTDKVLKIALRNHLDDLERRLMHVKFKQLTNEIAISNGRLIIPRMTIESSAMDLKMEGEHGFDDSIKYAFDFRFRDLRMDKSETQYGTIMDDGTGLRIYILMTGTLTNPVYKHNEEQRKEDRKEYNEQEVLNAKAMLQKEFGLFKKDTTLKIKETPREDVKFLYEWDEDKKNVQQKQDSTKAPDNKKRMDKLKNKLKIEEEQKQGFEVEK